MLDIFPSDKRIQRMNRRQRKKLHVGEFQELVFEIRVHFCGAMDGTYYGVFLDDFIVFIASRHLVVGGMVTNFQWIKRSAAYRDVTAFPH